MPEEIRTKSKKNNIIFSDRLSSNGNTESAGVQNQKTNEINFWPKIFQKLKIMGWTYLSQWLGVFE